MGLALFVALCLLASVLAPAASGQSQTSWYVNDNPSLNGPSRYWWAGDAGKGYGSNNYVYTYGTAGESSTGNWARWSMGTRVGRQEIQAYVPNTRATATVLYRIDIGGTQHTKSIAQNNAYGWTSLGTYNTDGDTVTITLRDNEATQHWNRHGYNNSSIGVDAIRMRCTSRCSTAPAATPAPVPTQAPQIDEPSQPRNLRVSADEDSATVSWNPPSNNGGAAITGYRADLYRGSTRVDRKNLSASQRSTAFSGLSADTAYQIRVSAENSAGRGTRATASFRTDAARRPQVSPPGAPRIVGFVNGPDTVGVVWNPPSDNGGAPITGYTIELYLNNRRIDTKTVGAGTRETEFKGLSADTAYQVRITARNTAGTSNPRTATARTGAATSAPSAPRSLRVSADEDSATVSWSAPSDDGGAAISGYRADLYRGSTRVERKSLSASQRSTAFTGLNADTAYQIRISAENSAGRSASAAAGFRTDPAPQRQQARSVTIALAADRAGCSDQSSPCRWLSASYSGFSPGSYRVRCYWSTSRSSLGSQFASFTTSRINGANPALCYFNGTPGRHLTVVVDGVQSNTIQFTGTPPAPQTTAPGAPRIVGFVNGADTVGVVWNPPSDNGGAPITGYTIDLYHNNRRINTKTLASGVRETTFTGLSPDTAYQVRITAHNTAGTSTPRTANARTGTATSTPSAPRNLSASAGENSATVSWSPPSDNGGAAISGYRADLYRGNTRVDRKNLSASQRSATFTGLSADTAYQIRVSAQNSAGRSDRAAASFRTDAASTSQESGLPSEPRSVRVTAGENRATVSWSPPASNGNNPLTGYQAELFRGGTFITRQNLSASQRSTSFSNLSADTAYQVLISARNNQGLSTPTAADFTTDAPEDTRSVTITLGADRANCQDTSKPCRWLSAQFSGFTPGRHNAHCYYSTTPTSLGTRSWSGTADTRTGTDPTLCWFNATPGLHLTAVIDGVQSNTIQLAGTSPSATPPSSPRGLRVSRRSHNSLSVSWSAPSSNGGSAITGYRVVIKNVVGLFFPRNILQEKRANAERLSATFSGLDANTVYYIQVYATNKVGENKDNDKFARDDAIYGRTTIAVPSAPRNVKVEILDIGDDNDYKDDLRITWDRPINQGSGSVTEYRICVKITSLVGISASTPSCKYIPYEFRKETVFDGSICSSHEVTVEAHNGHGWSEPARYSYGPFGLFSEVRTSDCSPLIAPAAPLPEVQDEACNKWTLCIDDADATVVWDPIEGAENYYMDWQYVNVNNEGDIVPLVDIDAWLRLPNDGPEIVFYVADSTFVDLRRDPDARKREQWNDNPRVSPTYRIHHRQKAYILQVRLRATGRNPDGLYWDTGYSEWYYDPRSVLSNGCMAYQVYDTIKFIINALEIAKTILTVGAIAATVVSFGAAAVAGTVARGTVTTAAKKIVAEIIENVTVRKLLKKFITEAVESFTKGVAMDTIELSVLFTCITFAADGDAWTPKAAKNLAGDMITDFMSREDKNVEQAKIDAVVNSVVDGMSSDLIYKHFSRR